MKRSQRQTQRRFRSLADYVYSTQPADIQAFLLMLERIPSGPGFAPMTPQQFADDLAATARQASADK